MNAPMGRVAGRRAAILVTYLCLSPVRVCSAQWQPTGVPLCTAPGEQLLPLAVPDGQGGAIVTWLDRRTGNLQVYVHHILVSGTPDPSWPANGVPVAASADPQFRH